MLVSVRLLTGVHSLYFTVHFWFWLHAYDYYRTGLVQRILESEQQSVNQNSNRNDDELADKQRAMHKALMKLDDAYGVIPSGDTKKDTMRYLKRLSPSLTLFLGSSVALLKFALNAWFLAIANVSPITRHLYQPLFSPSSFLMMYTFWRNVVLSLCLILALKSLLSYHRILREMHLKLHEFSAFHNLNNSLWTNNNDYYHHCHYYSHDCCCFYDRMSDHCDGSSNINHSDDENDNHTHSPNARKSLSSSDRWWHVIIAVLCGFQILCLFLLSPMVSTLGMLFVISGFSIAWLALRLAGRIPRDVWGLRSNLEGLMAISLCVLCVSVPVYVSNHSSDLGSSSLLAALDALPATIGVFWWFIFPRFVTEEDRLLNRDASEDVALDKRPLHQIKRWVNRAIVPRFTMLREEDNADDSSDDPSLNDNDTSNDRRISTEFGIVPLSNVIDNDSENDSSVIEMCRMISKPEGWFGFLFFLAEMQECQGLIFVRDCHILAQRVADEWLCSVSFMDSLSMFKSVDMPQKDALERKRKFREVLIKSAEEQQVEIPGFGAGQTVEESDDQSYDPVTSDHCVNNSEVMSAVISIFDHWIIQNHLDLPSHLSLRFQSEFERMTQMNAELEQCLPILDELYWMVYSRMESHYRGIFVNTQRYRVLSRVLF